jgi:predicted lactoylglutathione lyase
MIGYVTLGTRDYEKAAAFYDELLALLGAKRVMDEETFIAWGASMEAPALSVVKQCANGEPATVGNGVMVALAAGSTENVDAIHAKALALGGSDEGAPGLRFGNFYAGYFRDPDGNKLNAFCMKPED